MKEIFDVLSGKERKILQWFCLLLLVPVVFLLFVAGGERRSYSGIRESLTAQKESYQSLVAENTKKEKEWLKWQNTIRDIEEIREKYFYKDANVFEEMREDLQRIFSQTGIYASRKNYDYSQLRNGNLEKLVVSFDWKGSYPSLKRFLDSVEKLPKFLLVEKIDFSNIETQSGRLELKVTLAGYYEK
jgi:cell division protein FtsB